LVGREKETHRVSEERTIEKGIYRKLFEHGVPTLIKKKNWMNSPSRQQFIESQRSGFQKGGKDRTNE